MAMEDNVSKEEIVDAIPLVTEKEDTNSLGTVPEEALFDYYRHHDYYQYLDEIRQKVFRLVTVFIVLFLGGFFLTAPILKRLVSFFQIKGITIITNSPFQFLDLAMNTGLIIALVFCAPLFVYYVYNFLKDGFRDNEKKVFFILLPIALFLFLLGFSYGFAVLYLCLKAIAQVNINIGLQNLWDIDKYFSQIILTSVFLGFIFEYPVVLTSLIKFRIIKVSFLKKNRRYAIALIFILVSLLPPTDGLSLIIMALPLLLIYELTIFFNSFVRIKE